MDDNLIDEVVTRYLREYNYYSKLADTVFNICKGIVQKNLTIRATVQHRVKSSASLVGKLKRATKYKSIESVFEDINDLAGVRIITYHEADRPRVVREIQRVFSDNLDKEVRVEIKDKNGNNGKYYKATHCHVVLPMEYLADDIMLKNKTCEIQVCSFLSHVYNEIEHDLQYKPRLGNLSDEEKLLIDQLGLITRSGDIIIRQLLDATNERLKLHKGEFVDVHDFAIRMGELLKIGESFSNNAGLLYDEFIKLKLDSPEKIISSLLYRDESLIDIANFLYETFASYIASKNINVMIDKNSSDLLLFLLLRNKVSVILQTQTEISERDYSSRLLRIARIYKEMLSER